MSEFALGLYESLREQHNQSILAYTFKLDNGELITVDQLLKEANEKRRPKQDVKDVPVKSTRKRRASK